VVTPSIDVRCWLAGLLLFAGGVRAAEWPSEEAAQAAFPLARAVVQQHCAACHDAEQHEGGVQLDRMEPFPTVATRSVFERMARAVREGTMPPEDAPPLSDAERAGLLEWAEQSLAAFDARPVLRNGSVRRLTVAQYRLAIQDLLGIEDDVTGSLPADAISKEGFTNQAATLQLSPSQLEAYLEAAGRAIDAALVDVTKPPEIQRFRVQLGQGINPHPIADDLILGHISKLLPTADVLITEPEIAKPFAFLPVAMQRQFRFIEGYQGNDTVRGWRNFAGIEHAVFACLRGSDGDDAKDFLDPRGRGHEVVPNGLLLRPSIPSDRYLGVGSKYGPLPNFKVAVRELPDEGRFRVTVRAACYDDLLVVPPGNSSGRGGMEVRATRTAEGVWSVDVPRGGIYLVQVGIAGLEPRLPQPDGQPAADTRELSLRIGERQVTSRWSQPACVVVRLPQETVTIHAAYAGPEPIDAMTLVPLAASHELAERLVKMEQRRPWLGVHLGLRRDCGSTLAAVGMPQRVESGEVRDYVFEGAIANFPNPRVEADNPNYLAGFREIAVRSEYTSERDMPRLLVESVEFEGPLHEQWPPASQLSLMQGADADTRNTEGWARSVLRSFATRAFRRPATESEIGGLVNIWRRGVEAGDDPTRALRDAFVATLISPQFLFLVEASETPAAEPLAPEELASKLSFFLWNAPPDSLLLAEAAAGTLPARLAAETDRLLDDRRFHACAETFAAEWLRLDHFDVVEVDQSRFPHLSTHVRPHLRRQPAELIAHLIRSNAAVETLVRSEIVMVNEVVADYLRLEESVESGFAFLPVRHGREDLGGVITQPAVLAGLSNGREANPVKRGAWLARTLIAEPPADPPPNVPVLEDLTQLSLREKLQRHRAAKGCRGCHESIDPWGLPFEGYGADGRAILEEAAAIESHARLPDGTEVADFATLRDYLVEERLDRVALSFAWHLATYASGRRPTPQEERWLTEMASDVCASRGGLRDILHAIVGSEMFLTK
jgi:mono/diheme cytochrome c family protein